MEQNVAILASSRQRLDAELAIFPLRHRRHPAAMDKKWLQGEIEARGRGAQVKLAEFLGISASVLNKLIKGTRKITAVEADKIREWLARTPRETGEIKPAVPTEEPPRPTEILLAPDAPSLPDRMPLDVPLYGVAIGGESGHFADFAYNGTVVGYVRRPPRLMGRSDVFAVYAQGVSMAHWREPGQLIYAENNRPPRSGEYVLVEYRPTSGDDERRAMVKRLVSLGPKKIRLHQYNPPRDLEIDAARVIKVYRVIDWDEML